MTGVQTCALPIYKNKRCTYKKVEIGKQERELENGEKRGEEEKKLVV